MEKQSHLYDNLKLKDTSSVRIYIAIEDHGWCSGERAHLPPMWPGFDFGPLAYMSQVCCWFWPYSQDFFLVLWFSSLHKNQELQTPIPPGKMICMKTSLGWCGFLSNIVIN